MIQLMNNSELAQFRAALSRLGKNSLEAYKSRILNVTSEKARSRVMVEFPVD